ncbi:MAG: hypothetical protein LJE68_18080 [Rhodobacter sp.]|jgi:hypothetical protein|nr:hypothetical protein [Rhodobacter sp.]
MLKQVLCALSVVLAGQMAAAQQISAVAVSPDGATVMVAGDNRVLYTVDAATLDVTSRRYVPEQIRWMQYSSDGDTLFWRTQERTFAAVGLGSFKTRFSAENISSVAYAPGASRLLLLENNYKGGVLHLLAAHNGKNVLKLEMPELRTEDATISDDGATALLLTNSESSDAEEKAQPGSDLKGHAKFEFRQQHDGYISKIVAVDLKAGTFAVASSWYRISNPSQVRMLGDAAVFVNSVSDSGTVGADGSSRLLDLGERFSSHIRISDDGESIVMSSGRDVAVHPLADGVAGAPVRELEADDLPGPSERVTAMDEAADGTLYLGTSGYRLWKVAPGASEVQAAPVF